MCCQSIGVLDVTPGGERKVGVELGAVHCRVAGWRQRWEFVDGIGLLILD